MRLSRDDKLRTMEPDSIVSQRLMLMQYAETHGITVAAEYADSGESGTKWNRSGLQSLLKTIEAGSINTVLVKDLSRLSRDYLRTGELLENWFPLHKVRLIAVNDGVDTAAHSRQDDYTPIRAVMDDWYARDISKKVRAAIYARQAAGICTAASLPYGYRRFGEKICIDPEKSLHVISIFRIYAEHCTLRFPAEYLNRLGIPSPRAGKSGWSTATIRRILKNPAYTGSLHIHVTHKLNYKSTYRCMLPASEQIIIPVPPIVPQNLFGTVQHMLSSHEHKRQKPHWLSGRVICGDCGSRFLISEKRLLCGGRKRGSGCRCHSVLLQDLLAGITEAMKPDGIPTECDRLNELVEHILISSVQITVFVTYRKPNL